MLFKDESHLSVGTVCYKRDNRLPNVKRALKRGSYSHFPAHILTKSHRLTAQIPSSLCLSCSNLNPIPIFYCFFVDECQSQCMKSHFTSSGPSVNAPEVGRKISVFIRCKLSLTGFVFSCEISSCKRRERKASQEHAQYITARSSSGNCMPLILVYFEICF